MTGNTLYRQGIRLNANELKLIAIIAMTIDHTAWLLFPGYPSLALPVAMHILGRLTCPIMCYFIAEGYHYTRNISKYTVRLLIFSVIGHFAYVFASYDYINIRSFIPFYYGGVLNQTSVMWSLFCGLLMLRVVNSQRLKSGALKVLVVLLLCTVSFPADWSCIAALCILSFGVNRGKFRQQMLWMVIYVSIYALVYFFAVDKLYGIIQLGVVLTIPLLALYNGERGRNPRINRAMKWVFYAYYPLHLLVIGIIKSLA